VPKSTFCSGRRRRRAAARAFRRSAANRSSSSRLRYWPNAPRVCKQASTEESLQKRRLKVADAIRAYTARSTREINDTLPTHDPVPISDLWAPDGPRTRFSTHIKPMPAWVGGMSWLCDSYACTCHGFAGRVRTHTHTHTHTHGQTQNDFIICSSPMLYAIAMGQDNDRSPCHLAEAVVV